MDIRNFNCHKFHDFVFETLPDHMAVHGNVWVPQKFVVPHGNACAGLMLWVAQFALR
jgi:hypothetical protein